MAQRTIRVDDLDGKSEDATPLTFALEGVTYDIDLTEENAAQLRKALAKFIEVARARNKPKQKVPPQEGNSSRPKLDREQLAAIRRWGHSNGYEFSDQGRIPNHVMEAFEKFAGREKTKIFSSG